MQKAFYQIDLFGKAVLFNYKGSSKSKSKVGAICTIILCAFVIWVVIYFGQQLVNKSEPKTTTFQSFNENPAATPITIDKFVFAIGMADPVTYANYINESIFTAYASTYKSTRVPQANGTVEIIYEEIPLELETCQANHFGELADEFSYLALDQIYCLKKDQPNIQTEYPILQGSFESPVYQSIYIYFQECNNETSNVTCGTQAEINAKLEGSYLSLVFSNMVVDLTDYKNPLKKFRDGYYTTVGNSYYKELTLSLDQLEINTDSGWLTTNYKTEPHIEFGDIQELFSLTSKSSFAYFSMRLGNVMNHYNRSYTKIQEIIAQINGIVTIAFTILFIVLAPYVRLKFYEALINEIFDIKTLKRRSKNKKSNKRKAIKTEANPITTDHKNNSKPTVNNPAVPSSKQDLEDPRPPLESNEPGLSNRIEFTERKETDDANLMKRMQTLEESPLQQYNFGSLIHSPSLAMLNLNPNFTDPEIPETKQKISFARSRGFSGRPLTFSASQIERPLENNPELVSPLASPQDTKREALLLSRKPTFMQPNFKILDYEEHGQDLFEDILKNIYTNDKRHKRDSTDEYAISEIRSERTEKDEDEAEAEAEAEAPDETKRNNHPEVMPSEKIKQDSEGEKEPPEKERHRRTPHAKFKLQRLDLITSKNVEGINLSFCEYIRSWFSKSDAIKEKMCILKEGIQRINERLDIFNIFKKLREFDKLKVLILENEQFILFDSLPRPDLTLKDHQEASPNLNLYSQSKIKDPRFIQEKIKKDLILVSYENLKRKPTPTLLDKKLFAIYDDILCLK